MDYLNNLNPFSNSNQQQQQQAQKQKYASKEAQKQKTVQTHVFKNHIDNIYSSVLTLIKIADKFNESMTNMSTDLVINSLNNFGKACYELRKEKNNDALDIGRKTVYDKWDKLEDSDPNTFEKSLKYRNFMIKALNSKHLITYNVERILSNKDAKSQNKSLNNEKAVLNAYTKMIGCHNTFNKKVDSYHKNDINRDLQSEHEKELNEFRKNKKYKQKQQQYTQISKPEINGMYLTDSGKNSKFKMDVEHQNELDAVLGIDDEKHNHNHIHWVNGVVYFNNKNAIKNMKFGKNKKINIDFPLPVQVKIDTNVKIQSGNKYECKLPIPWRKRCIFVDPEQLKMRINVNNDENIVKKILKYEKEFIKKTKMTLGYPYVNGMVNDISGGITRMKID
eukprot:520089_1